jgi:hypothetical protein
MKKLHQKFNTRLGRIIGLVLVVITIILLPHFIAIATGVYGAVIIMSGTMDYASGKLGGIVYSHKGTTMYFKKWRKVSNPRSANQSICRQWQKLLVEAWNNVLNDDGRLSWNNYALITPVMSPKTGKMHTISGQNWFIKANPKTYAMSLVPGALVILVLTPPLPENDADVPILTSITLTATEDYTFPTTPNTWNIKARFFYTGVGEPPNMIGFNMSGPVNPGRSKAPQVYFKTIPTPSSGTPVDVTLQWTTKYGASNNYVGQKIYLTAWFVTESGGPINSPKLQTSCVITVPPPALEEAIVSKKLLKK